MQNSHIFANRYLSARERGALESAYAHVRSQIDRSLRAAALVSAAAVARNSNYLNLCHLSEAKNVPLLHIKVDVLEIDCLPRVPLLFT